MWVCVVILVYTILFMDWGEMAGINGKPFEKVSGFAFGLLYMGRERLFMLTGR